MSRQEGKRARRPRPGEIAAMAYRIFAVGTRSEAPAFDIFLKIWQYPPKKTTHDILPIWRAKYVTQENRILMNYSEPSGR